MSDNALPQGGPPPLPSRPVMPVQSIPRQPIPVQPVAAPWPFGAYTAPHMAAPYPQQPGQEYYAPHMAEEPPAGGANDWILWAIPIAAVLVLGVGAVVLLALREGPGKATAKVPPGARRPMPAPVPRPQPRPTPIVPPGNTRPGNTVPGNTGGLPGKVPPRVPPVHAALRRPAVPQVQLPRGRDMGRQLKEMWEICERNRMAFRTIRTLKSRQQGTLGVGPVDRKPTGTITALIPTEADVIGFIHALGATPRIADVNLVSTAPEPFGDRTVRKITLEYRLRDAADVRRGPSAGASPRHGVHADVPDPFQLPPSLEPAPKVAPPAANVNADAEAARAAQHLRLRRSSSPRRTLLLTNNSDR